MSKEVYPHELIGKEIEVMDSKNKSNLGIQGKVIDETKNTLVVVHDGETKVLIKDNITFRIQETGQVIRGKRITKRPEERLKGK